MELCPVCNKGMKNNNINITMDGIVYYLCCAECKANFSAEPRRYSDCCNRFGVIKQEQPIHDTKGDKIKDLENGKKRK